MLIPITHNETILFNTTENPSEIDGFIFTLRCIVQLFDEYFSKNDSHSLIISLDHSDNSPICYRQYKIILLDTDTSLWSQAAYQFSHELCHYMIPHDVCEKLRWFEESICEVSSYFFLPILSEQWKKQNVPYMTASGIPYADSFSSYVEENMTHDIIFDIHSQTELLSLENDCYQREKNRYTSKLLLPIFKKNPLIWHAVPYLCKISGNQSFLNSLTEWISISPAESQIGLQEILQLFS